MSVIKTEKLNCKVGYKYLLKDIDWTVNYGEKWTVFGMNGCGKTTLLSIIAGFRTYSSGMLTVLDKQYTEDNALDLRRRIGFVSNSFFDKNLSKEAVLDIVLAGKFGTLGIDGDITNSDIRRAKELLKELRMGDKINRNFDTLSKGERQNVLIARAFMGKPEIIILDEPGTGLDVYAREHMLSTVQDLAENTDMTLIYVTHYTEEILDVFDNCLLMKNGVIFKQGRTNEVFTEHNLADLLEYPVVLDKFQGRMQLSLQVKSNMRKFL